MMDSTLAPSIPILGAMSEEPCNKPIEHIAVETTQGGRYRVLTDLWGLAEYMLHEWPDHDRESPALDEAKRQVIAAYEGTLSPGAARVAFIAAADAAGVWTMRAGRPDPVPGYKEPRWRSRSKPRRRH